PAARADAQVVRAQVRSVGRGDERDVDVVIDDEERPGRGRDGAQFERELEQVSPRQRLVPELHDIRAATKDRTREGDDVVRGAVRRDCVETRPLQTRVGVYAAALAAG